ncbi:MAG: hypothetical protein LBF27_04325 [Sphingobacterium sp.]|jgi:hypothetical protein|nr:hypothetical protein [Sphingobacterium sp.]
MNERKAKILLVVREVLLGKLSVEDALEQTRIKDKRTLIHWIKVVKDIDKIDQDLNKETYHNDIDKHSIGECIKIDQLKLDNNVISSDKNPGAKENNSELAQKIIVLQSELTELKRRNKEFLRFQNILTNKINNLEILIDYAEWTYKVEILKV